MTDILKDNLIELWNMYLDYQENTSGTPSFAEFMNYLENI